VTFCDRFFDWFFFKLGPNLPIVIENSQSANFGRKLICDRSATRCDRPTVGRTLLRPKKIDHEKFQTDFLTSNFGRKNPRDRKIRSQIFFRPKNSVGKIFWSNLILTNFSITNGANCDLQNKACCVWPRNSNEFGRKFSHNSLKKFKKKSKSIAHWKQTGQQA